MDILLHRQRLLRLLARIILAAVGLHFIIQFLFAPSSGWNDMRLAPTFYLFAGKNVYGTAGEPPLTVMYGPVMFLAFAPVILARSAAGAIYLGSLLAFMFGILAVMVPTVLLWQARLRSGLESPRWLLLLPFTAVVLIPSTWFALFTIHADAPALVAISTAACLLAGKVRGRYYAAALLCVLAVGCKITYVSVPLALVLALWRLEGIRKSLHFGAIFLGMFVAACALAGCVFGPAQILDAVISIPGKQPWRLLSTLDTWNATYSDAAWKVVCAEQAISLVSLDLLPLLLLPLVFRGKGRGDQTASFEQRWREVTWCVAGGLFLSGIAGFSKIGGALNALGGVTLMLILLTYSYGTTFIDNESKSRGGMWVLIAVTAISCLRLVNLYASFGRNIDLHLYTKMNELLDRSPEKLWFPSRPLAHWYKQKMVTPSGDVIFSCRLSSSYPSESWLRAHLPAQASTIVTSKLDPPSMQESEIDGKLRPDERLELPSGFTAFILPPLSKFTSPGAAESGLVR